MQAPGKKSRNQARIGSAVAGTPCLRSRPLKAVCTSLARRACTRLTWPPVVFAVSLLASLSAGYALGALTGQGNTASTADVSAAPKPTQDAQPNRDAQPNQDAQSEESDSEDEDVADGDLSAVKPGFLEPCKMVDDSCSREVASPIHFLARYSSSVLTSGCPLAK